MQIKEIAESSDQAKIQSLYDATATWLRDCVRKGDVLGVKKAEFRLKQLENQLR